MIAQAHVYFIVFSLSFQYYWQENYFPKIVDNLSIIYFAILKIEY